MENELKDWIDKELILSNDRDKLLYVLDQVKERAKDYFMLSRGKQSIIFLPRTRKLPKEWQIYLYFVSKAYGYICEIFKETYVTTKEVEKALKIPGRTIRRYFKKLHDEGWIIIIKRGKYELNRSKLLDAFETIEAIKNE